MTKNVVSNVASVCHLDIKNLNSGQINLSYVIIRITIPNLIEIVPFFTEICHCQYNDFDFI